MRQTWLRRSSALLAAGAMLFSSAAALASPVPDGFAPGDSLRLLPDRLWQEGRLSGATPPETAEEPATAADAAPEEADKIAAPDEPTLTDAAAESEPVRFLLRLPAGGGTAALLDEAGGMACFSGEGDTLCLSALPGQYTLVCGSSSAELRVQDDAGVTVLSGEAAWDGEQLSVGLYGTLELWCTVTPDTQRLVSLTAAGSTQTLPAAYDPQLDEGQGCVVCHRLTLPAGTVELTCGGLNQRLVLQPGQTLRVEF